MELRKIFLLIALTLALLTLVDIAISKGFEAVLTKLDDGQFYKIDHTLHHNESDILIVGSSVAESGLNPPVFTDTLGMSCWNGARAEQTVRYFQAVTEEVLERYRPRLVILVVDNGRLQHPIMMNGVLKLKPFAHRDPELSRYLYPDSRFKQLMTRSSLVAYNSTILFFLRPMLTKSREFPIDDLGQYPRYNDYSGEPVRNLDVHVEADPLDSGQIEEHEKLLHAYIDAGVPVAMVTAPYYNPGIDPNPTKDQLNKWANDYPGVIYLDYSNDARFNHRNDYFSEEAHLNYNGSIAFSKSVAHDIKMWIAQHPDWLIR